MRRYKKAIPERNKQTEAHRGFTASLQPQDVQAWEKMCEEWDAAVFPRQMESPYAIEAASKWRVLFSSASLTRNRQILRCSRQRRNLWRKRSSASPKVELCSMKRPLLFFLRTG